MPIAPPIRALVAALSGLLLFTAIGSAQAATTYYVRTDGGTAAQCTGKADAAYSGSGTSQACAWKHPYYALPPNETARIAGGDTLIIGSGSYMIGWGAPGAADKSGRCYAGGPYDCYLPPIPSGPSPTAKTRILGKDAKNPPKLWGTERVTHILNLNGSSNVEIGNLEITDQSDCVEGHSNAGARCERNTAPYGQWASAGLVASNSKNVWLHDLNIHGLAHSGIHAGGLTDWLVERVKINANGWVGWDGDIGAASSNAGQIVLREVEIGWNGCGERWQTGAPWACWAQEGGGYGDGLGTAKTGGQWLIEDSFIHHNTSDGLDLLYMDGAASSSVTVRRVYAVGNAGNQLKVHGNSTIENSVVNGNCAYFNGKDFMLNGDQCRAMGNTLSVGLVAGQTANIRHNTIVGEGDCLILTGGGTSTTKLNIQNNVLVGKPDFLATRSGWPEQTCAHYADGGSAIPNFAGNLVWQTKGQCPPGSVCDKDPKLKNMTLASFDPEPLAGSPVIDKAIAIDGMHTDFRNKPRPSGPSSDIGAIETQRKK
ncbi:right-handed parallel beta-helix repeat-containing protein [Lysobacter sp. CW239]|uniref:right-handed parallel beta-helix repeat-containing protein n=2 Tax=Lysobacteraceae TaxID=32033 RepID=UPI001745EEEE|nr:right-handed parallel beta-helix repeat-containing protein [Lysobacter sp. CW239]QOD92028.1 right-handed parallel beta-helix repeat-containing protein [Lysobacter sp. CW239]